jgi:drug/metabolite transporter (DMT)-like permease
MGLTAAAVIGATSAGLFSAVCVTAKDLLSKRLAFRIDGATSTFASFAFALPFYVVVLGALYWLGLAREFTSVFVTFVILRAVTDTLAEGLKMYAFAHGDISVVTTIFSMSPLILLVIAPWITGESLSWLGLGAMLLVTAGSLVLVCHPAGQGWASQKRAIVLAATASFFFALNNCFDSLAMKGNKPTPGDVWSPVVAGFAMTLVSAALVAPFTLLRSDRRRSLRTYQGGLWARGFLEVVFMSAKLYAMQFIESQYVLGLMRLSVVLTIIGGWLFFKEGDFRRRLAAGLLVVAGVALIPWLKAREAPQAEEPPPAASETRQPRDSTVDP